MYPWEVVRCSDVDSRSVGSSTAVTPRDDSDDGDFAIQFTDHRTTRITCKGRSEITLISCSESEIIINIYLHWTQYRHTDRPTDTERQTDTEIQTQKDIRTRTHLCTRLVLRLLVFPRKSYCRWFGKLDSKSGISSGRWEGFWRTGVYPDYLPSP